MILKVNPTHQVAYADIIALKADVNYTNVILADKKIISSHTLKIIEQRLNSNLFVKINRSVVVNKNFIKIFNNDKLNAFVTLTNNESFAVSRNQYSSVCLALF
jgi:two-component system, LytTR family, response regulator